MYPDVQDLDIIQQKDQKKYVKIEIISRENGVVLDDVVGDILSDNGTIDRNSGSRRIYNVTMRVTDSSFYVGEDCKIWLNKDIRAYVGILDKRTSNVKWYIIGTFVIEQAGYLYDVSNNSLSLSLYDKMALLDGTLGGTVYGTSNVVINRFVNDIYYSKVEIYNDDDDEIDDSTLMGGGTVITIPLPKYVSGGTDDSIDGGKSHRITKLDVIIEGKADTDTFTWIKPLYSISYNSSLDGKGEKVREITEYGRTDGSWVCHMGVQMYYRIPCITITARQSVYLKYITLKATINGESVELVTWRFSDKGTVKNKKVITEDFSNEIKNFTYVDLSMPSDKVVEELTLSNGQVWNIGKISVDTRIGEENTLREIFESGLSKAGIIAMDIKNDIYETIPYDQEFQVGANWYEIFSTLVDLYPDLEMYFDVNGVFILRHISTIEDDNIVLDNDILSKLVVSEQQEVPFSEIYNVTEVWGQSLESDYYSENDDENLNNVILDGSNFKVKYDDLLLSDSGKIPNGTILAFKTPEYMSSLTDSPSLTINSIRLSVTDIKNVSKIFTGDDFKESENSKTGYQIDEDLQYAISFPGITLYTEDVKLEGATGYKYFPDIGADNWSKYGVKNVNREYKANGVALELDHVIGSNEKPVQINGIDFHGIFYNMQNANDMVKIDTEKKEYSINLNIRKYCLYIKAKIGDVYRIYYTHLNGNLYAADKDGKFSTEKRPFVEYGETIEGMSYCDFVPQNNDEYYIFWYSTESDAISFRLYGMSKIAASNNKYPIVNYSTKLPIDPRTFSQNTSYCIKYDNGTIYYMGQWQIRGVAIEVMEVPEYNSVEYQQLVSKFNTNNFIFTQYDPRLSIEKIGIKNQALSGTGYEDIFTDDLAAQRAGYENWKSLRVDDKVVLTTIQIPWLDVNEKVTYRAIGGQLKTYIVDRISFSSTAETITIELNVFYPLYI